MRRRSGVSRFSSLICSRPKLRRPSIFPLKNHAAVPNRLNSRMCVASNPECRASAASATLL